MDYKWTFSPKVFAWQLISYIIADQAYIPLAMRFQFCSLISNFYMKGIGDSIFGYLLSIHDTLFILSSKDKLLWAYSSLGYTTWKEADDHFQPQGPQVSWVKFICQSYIKPSSSILFWHLKLKVHVRICLWVEVSASCFHFCRSTRETQAHLFVGLRLK